MTESDDALRYDQGIQVCGCGDLTVSCYHGRPCCPTCYPERRAEYRAQLLAPTWQTDQSTQEARSH